eukprot:11406878-Ditylum_brightwellii.AAC.1
MGFDDDPINGAAGKSHHFHQVGNIFDRQLGSDKRWLGISLPTPSAINTHSRSNTLNTKMPLCSIKTLTIMLAWMLSWSMYQGQD